MDITKAAGVEPVLTADHDGRLIADMVAEWASTHTDPIRLELTGPAGGDYRRGNDISHHEVLHTVIDSVDFIRGVSGRAPGEGVLTHALPF